MLTLGIDRAESKRFKWNPFASYIPSASITGFELLQLAEENQNGRIDKADLAGSAGCKNAKNVLKLGRKSSNRSPQVPGWQEMKLLCVCCVISSLKWKPFREARVLTWLLSFTRRNDDGCCNQFDCYFMPATQRLC